MLNAETKGSKKPRAREEVDLTFSSADLVGVQVPHNDPLLLTVDVCGFDVRRILIDSGSSMDIMYYGMFQKLGKRQEDLIPVSTQLLGLESFPVWPLGMLRTEVTIGGKAVEAEFLVVNVSSSYNAILGRPWLHADSRQNQVVIRLSLLYKYVIESQVYAQNNPK